LPLRLIDVVIPNRSAEDVRGFLEGDGVIDVHTETLPSGSQWLRVLCAAEHAEQALDALQRRFGTATGFRALLLPVEATVPAAATPRPASAEPALRIARAELVADVSDATGVSRVFLVTVMLSTVVAAVGLVRSATAVIIGAMVIAPLLGPNMAMALGTTLGDLRLVSRSVRASAIGIALAFTISVLIGLLLGVDASIPEIAARTRVETSDVALALASGVAGALAYTTAAPASLIGVMVAVALLPPLVTTGLLVAGGHLAAAEGAGLLLVTNMTCVNLAAVISFRLQGLRPRAWWPAERVRRGVTIATTLWALLLAALVVAIALWTRR
jgi:uncharacterized hydrophobic protein (TIGR00341 family)